MYKPAAYLAQGAGTGHASIASAINEKHAGHSPVKGFTLPNTSLGLLSNRQVCLEVNSRTVGSDGCRTGIQASSEAGTQIRHDLRPQSFQSSRPTSSSSSFTEVGCLLPRLSLPSPPSVVAARGPFSRRARFCTPRPRAAATPPTLPPLRRGRHRD